MGSVNLSGHLPVVEGCKLAGHGLIPIFQKRRLPRLKFRIGIDSGEAVVTNIGDISSKHHKDLIGQTINLATKIQSAAGENEIIIGHTMLIRLGVYRRKLFEEYKKSGWDYKLINTQHAYPLYKLGNITLY
ncbi:MAG TPA: adenylate/guanylate cyclase domain-containing protein [Nitrososphaeraceae archaeon]|nr:adenylate/guanylate cyclase domain-containing protein [Nitrososphaeraceae archaeon]